MPSNKSAKNVKQRRAEGVAELIDIASKLWDDVCSQPTPKKPADLWAEHLLIRQLLDQMRAVNPDSKPVVGGPEAGRIRLQKVKSFLDWCETVGVKSDCVKVDSIGEFGDSALGLRATESIAENRTLVSVPRKAMMTWDDAVESHMLAKALRCDPLLGGMENVALAVHLICEKLSTKASNWQPYLDVLPDTYTTPLYFSVEQMELLRPCTELFESALNMYRGICRQFVYFFLQLAPKSRSEAQQALLPPNHPLKAKAHNERLLDSTPLTVWSFTFDVYKWAVATVSTRINMVPSKVALPAENGHPQQIPALIPYLDLANHDDSATAIAVSPDLNVMYDGEIDSACCYANRAYQAGDQVFIHYGNRSNAQFLLHNGFVPLHSSRYKCTIKLGLSKTDVNYDLRVAALAAQGLTDNEEFVLWLDASSGVDKKTLKVLPDRLVHFVRAFVVPMNDGQSTEPLESPTNDFRTYKYIRDRLNLLNLMYAKSIKPIMLKGNEVTDSDRMIDRLLQAEYKVVKAAIKECDDVIKSVDEDVKQQVLKPNK